MKSEGMVHLIAMVALERAGVHLTRDIVSAANTEEEWRASWRALRRVKPGQTFACGRSLFHGGGDAGTQPASQVTLECPQRHSRRCAAARISRAIPITRPFAAGATDRPSCSHAGLEAYGLDPCITENKEAERREHGVDELLSIANIEFDSTLITEMIHRMQ